MIVLQNRWAGEVKGEAKLSFNRSFCIDFHPTYSGFEAFKECLLHEQFITDIVLRLTQEWTAVTNRVLEEMTATIHDVCGDSTEWQEINLRSVSSSIIVRSISRVFVATDFSRDAGWLATAEGYTMNARNAALALDKWPAPLRFIAHRFNSASATIRQDYSRTQAMVRIELARRREEMSMARKAGKSLPKYDDALEYMNDLSVRRGIDLDHTAWLLALSIASLHTPIDALAHLLIDIADKPEVVQPLRDEIVETVSENGWRKAVYYKMKVMDSFLKESQRVHPAEDSELSLFSYLFHFSFTMGPVSDIWLQFQCIALSERILRSRMVPCFLEAVASWYRIVSWTRMCTTSLRSSNCAVSWTSARCPIRATAGSMPLYQHSTWHSDTVIMLAQAVSLPATC
jgi:hypothetical protein